MVFQLIGKLSQRVVLLQQSGIGRKGYVFDEIGLVDHHAVDEDDFLGRYQHLLDARVFHHNGFLNRLPALFALCIGA